jgi:nucleoside-diphosphate-sugar epimerase
MITLHPNQTVPGARTVIVGSGGFVGQASARALQAISVPILNISRNEIDLLSTEAADQLAAHLAPSDSLIFAAAIAPVKNSAMLVENLRMMQAVCAALKKQPVAHVTYISSDAVYRDSMKPLSESSCAEPASLHGVMHLAREIMLRSELSEIPLVCVRPTLIYGAADPHNGYGPNRFLRLALAGKDISLFGEGEEQRDHIHIDDVVEIVSRCVRQHATGVVNAVSGKIVSFRAAAETAIEVSGSHSKIVSSTRSGPMPHNGYRPFDASVLRAKFPDFTPIPFHAGLSQMCSALNSNLHSVSP